jgi:hypothetical protein
MHGARTLAKSVIALTFCTSLVLGGASAASAQTVDEDESVLSPEAVAYINESFDRLGVDADARAGLLAKYEAGLPDDAASGTVQPSAVDTFRVGITEYTRKVFPDGSVSLVSLERPTTPQTTGGVTPLGISGCKYIYSAGVASYSNCKVEKSLVNLTMWYRSDYWQSAYGSGASVTNTWDWDVQSAGAACTQNFLGNTTSTATRIRAAWTFIGGIASTNPYVELKVTKTSAVVNANW